MSDERTPLATRDPSGPPEPEGHRAEGAAAGARAALASAATTVRDAVRPPLVRVGRFLALLAWRIWITVGPALRAAGRAVVRTVQRAEEVAVPALQEAGRAITRGLQRVQDRIATGVTRGGRAVRGRVDRAERRAVPVIAAGGSRTAGVVARGNGAVASAFASGTRGLVNGLSRAPSRTAENERTLQTGDVHSGYQDGEPMQLLEGEFVPPATDLRPPTPLPEARRGRLRSALASTAGMLATAGIVVLAVTLLASATVGRAVDEGVGAVGVSFDLPDNPTLASLRERSYIYASNGQELDVIDQEENRKIVDLAAIPLVIQQAIITAEDQTFYEHKGYDPQGIGRAIVTNIEERSLAAGGSTITQQLAKSAVGEEDTFGRKFEELAYAIALEQEFSKEELLGQYLNQVFFGEASYGVAAAAEEYFGITDLNQMRVDQAALLAAMIRSPNSANPRSNPDVALDRRNAILDSMVTEGYLPADQVAAAKAAPLDVVPNTPRVRPYDFIADSVTREFLSAPEFAQFGATWEERRDQLNYGGLRIYSSLDPRLQEAAKAAIAANFPNPEDENQPTGAIVTVEPRTGRILAAHSGLNYDVEQLAIPTQGRRQPGSAAKPFIYAEALEQGFSPRTPLSGTSPAYYERINGWTRADGGVQNYGGQSYGTLDMFSALRNSVNTAAVQLALVVGVENVVNRMSLMGIDTADATNGKVTEAAVLGGFDEGVTPLEMASAYGVFANGGIHVKAHFIDRIEDRNGNRLYEAQPAGQQVLNPAVNATMVDMMQGVVTGGTGTRARIPGWPVAGKTGTTQDNKDAWFVGYTPTLSTAMWMGVAKRPRPLGRVTGGGLPAQVWRQYMGEAVAGSPPVPFPEVERPEGRLAPGQPVTVPDVTRRSLRDAQTTLTEAKLFGTPRQTPSDAPAGTVIGQSPRAGTQATTGDSITLSVSTGQPAPPPPPTPEPQPAPEQQAQAQALGQGLVEQFIPRRPDAEPPGQGNGNGNGNGQGNGNQGQGNG